MEFFVEFDMAELFILSNLTNIVKSPKIKKAIINPKISLIKIFHKTAILNIKKFAFSFIILTIFI
jgi:hypothetical protein